MPDATTYGMNNGSRNGAPANGSVPPQVDQEGRVGPWQCSDKQRDLILKIVREQGLNKNAIEQTAFDLFGVGVRELNRLQASGLIDDLLERTGQNRRNGKRSYRRDRAPIPGREEP
jgi:hypothetical protein